MDIYIYVWLIANNGVTYCYREIGVSVTVILAIRHLKERRYNCPFKLKLSISKGNMTLIKHHAFWSALQL